MIGRSLFDWPDVNWRNPLTEFERMRRQMDALSDIFLRGQPARASSPGAVFPLVNITEDANNYYIRAELPGMKAEDLDIQVIGRSLTIAGERTIPAEEEGATYHRREREAGKFSRIMSLPGDIDTDAVDARMDNGLLTVRIPKAEAVKPRQIAVN